MSSSPPRSDDPFACDLSCTAVTNFARDREIHHMSRVGSIHDLQPAEIVAIKTLTRDSKLVRIRIFGPAQFLAGQYMAIHAHLPLNDPAEPGIFPGTYSVASPPSALPMIEVAVQTCQNPRNMKHYLCSHASVGTRVYVDGTAYGAVAVTPRMALSPLSWNGGRGGLCLIAGGFGIPALVSIAKELLGSSLAGELPHISLVHSVRSGQDVPFLREVLTLEAEHQKTFKAIHTITGDASLSPDWSGRRGRIDAKLLAELVPGTKLFCVFGSSEFVKGIVSMLLDLGVWPANIRTDYAARVDPALLRKAVAGTTSTGAEGAQQMGSPTSLAPSVTGSPRLRGASSPRAMPKTNRMRRQSRRLSTTSPSLSAVSDTPGVSSLGLEDSQQQYLRTTGMDQVLRKLAKALVESEPSRPVSFLIDGLKQHLESTPEVANTKALSPAFWCNYWETDALKWHAPLVSPWLLQYEREFVVDESQSHRIFVPLCGKSADMMYLLNKGHTVIGADCSGIACADFFAENKIPGYERKLLVESKEGTNEGQIVVHRSTERSIELYECDIFHLTKELIGGPVSLILDRAALVALHPSCIVSRYIPLFLNLLEPETGRCLLASVSELPEPVAPPHCYTREQIERTLATGFHEVEYKHDHRYRLDAGFVVEPIYLLRKPRVATAPLSTPNGATQQALETPSDAHIDDIGAETRKASMFSRLFRLRTKRDTRQAATSVDGDDVEDRTRSRSTARAADKADAASSKHQRRSSRRNADDKASPAPRSRTVARGRSRGSTTAKRRFFRRRVKA